MLHRTRWLSLLLLAACRLRAQPIPLSETGSVMQMVGHTAVEIRYHRPVARGRELFGSLVPWDRVWSPSADTAAIISFSTPVRVDGRDLAAGTYSLWAIPGQQRWIIIFSAEYPTFHMRYPQSSDVLRVEAVPTKGQFMATLAFYFPLADADSAVLALHWGETVVPLSLKAGS